jgi:hypothetical protein
MEKNEKVDNIFSAGSWNSNYSKRSFSPETGTGMLVQW